MNRAWEEAVRGLADQIEAWRPEGFDAERRPGEGPIPRLVLTRGDRHVYLEPAWWAGEELPARVDLWSDLARSVRLVGPQPDGGWKVTTSDRLDLRVEWEKDRVRQLFEDLIAL